MRKLRLPLSLSGSGRRLSHKSDVNLKSYASIYKVLVLSFIDLSPYELGSLSLKRVLID